jgi:hypothetical protein
MNTAKYNLSFQSGETVRRDFQILTANNTPFPLAEYTITSVLRETHTSLSASAVFTTSILNAGEGRLRLELPASSSALLTGSCYFYDIRFVNSSGSVLYPLEGKVIVSPSITRG